MLAKVPLQQQNLLLKINIYRMDSGITSKLPAVAANFLRLQKFLLLQLAYCTEVSYPLSVRSADNMTWSSLETEADQPRQRVQCTTHTAVLQFLDMSSNDDKVANDFDTYLTIAVNCKSTVDSMQSWKLHDTCTHGLWIMRALLAM